MVLENNPILYTMNMDATVKWFENTLGWHGGIDARDEEGNGTYGCLLSEKSHAIMQKTRTFQGFHMFRGEPVPQVVGFILVSGLDALHRYVTDSGWTGIDQIHEEPWGARVCHVTNNDGYVFQFCELV